MVLLVKHPPGRDPERTYAFDVILREFLGLDYEAQPYSGSDICITVVGDERQRQLSIADVLLALPEDQWLQTGSLPVGPLAVWEPRDGGVDGLVPASVPVIYGRQKQGTMFEASENEAYLGVDIFGSAFFMLTRYEEFVSPDRDQFDRFPASASLAFREGFLERPVINEYLEILWSALQRLWPELRRPARQYRAFVTHDVDVLSLHGRSITSVLGSVGIDLFKRREPALAVRRLGAYWKSRPGTGVADSDPYNTFDFLMDVSEESGLRDGFFFVTGNSNSGRDPTYDFGNQSILSLLQRIHQRGHEIGFHGSFETYRDGGRSKSEVNRLRHICDEAEIRQDQWGGRQHYLRWENPTTWQNWEECGLNYDSTMGYAQQVGFRCGCCFEFPVFNLSTRERLRLRERPLVAMESSLLTYMKYSIADTELKVNELIDICRRYRGDFTLLWHNHMLAARATQDAYRRIVRMAAP